MTQGAVEVIASEFLAARSATSVCRLPPWRALCRRAPLLERPPERILRMSGPGQVENLCLSGSCIHKASYSGNGQGLSTRSGSCVALLECPFRAHRRHPGASGLPQKSTLRLGPVRYLTPKRRLSCCVNLSIPFSLTVPRLGTPLSTAQPRADMVGEWMSFYERPEIVKSLSLCRDLVVESCNDRYPRRITLR